ncbi:hypothetical protein SAMN05216303_1175 [Rhodoferax sp. OV413]|nr:hypothetical protein SAMN05216303_1175 [Rhodoferax sp. OV413]
MWGVAFLTQHSKDVLPFVVSVSNDLGLIVFDPQLGKVYVPGGRVLGHDDGPLFTMKAYKPWWKVW